LKTQNRRVISTMTLGAFMVAVVTGLVFSVPPVTVFTRSVEVALVVAAISGIVVAVIERFWTK
jgi:hypothetical protein